ncbi:MAG: hypothetical protein HC854_02535 [Flavobacterium sp.]|nr:hypothetical protein [Flavobacterium sp.]
MKTIIKTFLCIAFFTSTVTFAQTKTFSSNNAHYADCPSPSEDFSFSWDEKSGKITNFYWNHSAGADLYYLYTNGSVVSKVVKDPETLYDYNVYLYVTTKKYATTAYQIRGRMTVNGTITNNKAVFSGVYEGTGTYWISASGSFKY